jgi:hypothetical protein
MFWFMAIHLLSSLCRRQPLCQTRASGSAVLRRGLSRSFVRAGCPRTTSVQPMLYHGNTILCALGALFFTVLGPQIVNAQQGTPSDEPPGLIQTLDAFALAEPWVRRLEVPENADGPSVVGACVTLRFDGKVIGIGTVYGAGTLSLPEAARLAIAQAREQLPVVKDAMAEERLRLAAGQMTISVELAGSGVPLGQGSYEQVAAVFVPGTHGVALRIDDFISAAYPGEMLWMNQEATSALQRLISVMTGDVGLSLRPLEEVLEADNVTVLRFRTRQVAQLKPGGEARLLERGGKHVMPVAVRSREALEEWTDGLAGFLIGMRDAGTYLPVAGTPSEPAQPFDSALRMYVLTRLATVTNDEALAKQAIEEASLTANKLLRLIADGNRIGLPADSLLVVSCPMGLAIEEDLKATQERLRGVLLSVSERIESFPANERPMIAWGLARLGETEAALEIMPACRRVESPGQYPGLMPWLGYAERELAGTGDITAAISLRQMRNKLWEFQLKRSDLSVLSPDLQGGIVFTAARNPAPTWSAARPLSFVAVMLGDPRFTETDEVGAEMVLLFDSLRFLRQLSVGHHEAHMYQSPEAAMWGTRAAVWDQKMPISASSMTLLVLCETLESLDALEAAARENQP